MYVTRHSEIRDADLVGRLWALYARSYARTARETPTHEMLDRDEFREQLSSSLNRLWVVWEDALPVAMALVSTDVRSTRWLSESYFEARYPDRYRAGEVHYIVWVTVDPGHTDARAVTLLARHALATEAKDGALLVFDTPEVNHGRGSDAAAELLLRLSRLVGEAELVPLTVQRYWALDFAPAGAAPAGGNVAPADVTEQEAGRPR
jgi:hypothetical protein